MRVGAVVGVVAGIAVRIVRDCSHLSPSIIAPGLFFGLALLLLYPSVHDSASLSFRCYLVEAVCCGAVLFLPVPSSMVILIGSVMLVMLQVYVIVSRFSSERSFISNMAVWHHIEDCERLVITLVYLVLALFFMAFPGSGAVLQWTVIVLAAVAFCLRYYQLYYNLYMFFSKKRLKEIKRHLRGRALPATPLRTDDEMERINALYDRVLKVMEEKSPYLDPELKISDLAALLFTNRVYLSRTINVISGVNFNQFINSYRVEYAKELMKKDPRLQVQEVAMMSGFQTTASFNMAFKLFQGMTPGQYGKNIT